MPDEHGIMVMPSIPVKIPFSYDGSPHQVREIAPYSIGYLPPGVSTSGEHPDNMHAIYIRMSRELLKDAAQGVLEYSSIMSDPNPEMSDAVVKNIGLALGALADNQDAQSWAIVLDSLSISLAARVMQMAGGKPLRPMNTAVSRIDRATEFIRASLGENITLKAIAEAANTSQFHLSRQFRRETGITITRFISRERVACAKRKLRQTALPLVDIANQCGFASQSHMTTLVKHATGVTPAAYRASFK